jgi:2-methoxy-6-polyprenyl-1,4-benzoquinol methylase
MGLLLCIIVFSLFQEDFKAMIQDAGFCEVNYENLSFGVAAIHSGFKL